jgi:putative heme-binding domain-containing protein
VAGYGVKGSNDRESPMPMIHKPPTQLTIDELIAVDTWLFVREGEEAPAAADIRAAYEKFIQASDRAEPVKEAAAPAGGAPAGPMISTGADKPEDMIMKMGCVACHKIPTTAAKFGAVGPVLMEKTTAPKRIASPGYRARMKAGKAHATTPKEYIIESIVNPSTVIASGYEPMLVITKDGQYITGILKRDDPTGVTLVDNEGKTITIPASEIDQKAPQMVSIMPGNLAEILSVKDLHDILAYIMTLQ